MSRQSYVKCPVCASLLNKPDPKGDWFDWDCYNCGLVVPNSAQIAGIALIEYSRTQPDPKLFLKEMLGYEPN